jgi:hypothetical protein
MVKKTLAEKLECERNFFFLTGFFSLMMSLILIVFNTNLTYLTFVFSILGFINMSFFIASYIILKIGV